MPKDNRRVNGPDDSVSYTNYSRQVPSEDKWSTIFDGDFNRKLEKRANDESRKLFIKLGAVATAKGSCYLERGNTKILTTVYGPRDVRVQNTTVSPVILQCEVKFAVFSASKRRPAQTSTEEKMLSIQMKQILSSIICTKSIQNTQIDIFVSVIVDDGAIMSTALVAAGLALVEAGIPMIDMLTAATVGVYRDKIYCDPTAAEEKLFASDFESNHGLVTIVRNAQIGSNLGVWQEGSFSYDVYSKAQELLNRDLLDMKDILSKKIVQNVDKANIIDCIEADLSLLE